MVFRFSRFKNYHVLRNKTILKNVQMYERLQRRDQGETNAASAACPLMLPLCALGADVDDADDWDWRADWEEYGYFDFLRRTGRYTDHLRGRHGLGEARTSYWDDESGERHRDRAEVRRMVRAGGFTIMATFSIRFSLPSTLRYLGMESFAGYDFTEFTLPAQLECWNSLPSMPATLTCCASKPPCPSGTFWTAWTIARSGP